MELAHLDIFTDKLYAYAVKGDKVKRVRKEHKLQRLVGKGYEVFATYDMWKILGRCMCKGVKSEHQDCTGFYFTDSQVYKPELLYPDDQTCWGYGDMHDDWGDRDSGGSHFGGIGRY